MDPWLVVAGPLGEKPDAPVPPTRWIRVPAGRPLRVREGKGILSIEEDPEFRGGEGSVRWKLLPPAVSLEGWGELRLDVFSDEDGLVASVPSGEGPAASVVEVDHGTSFHEEPRALLPWHVLRLRHGSPASYRLIVVEAERERDQAALVRALALGARSLDALGDEALAAVLVGPKGQVPKDRPTLWRLADAALRERRDARLPFLSILDAEQEERVAVVWRRVIYRALRRLGLRTPSPVSDGARDWFSVVRPAVDRLRHMATGERDLFAAGVACALDALGEPSALPRFVPLARVGDREQYGLTLARPGNPQYRLFDVTRTKDGDALVSNGRTQSAPEIQRIHVTRCVCGGKVYERDHFCRGCGKKLSELGAMIIHGTFVVGAVADVAALCACGGDVGGEDRFCGGCGRSLEELGG
ncbi:hypothetical protein HY251_09065 [bacterium]|nr:hypothetical protein [bacterium]